MHAFASELYPLCRSITGAGVRQTLDRVGARVDLQRTELATGTQVFDWTVPQEWKINEAWIDGPDGKRLVDFANHNLHVASYSRPFRGTLSLGELRAHVHTDPDNPHWIPYRTSYYADTWGFCVSDADFSTWPEGEYRVCVDAELFDGALSYAEFRVDGETDDEILFFTHICHPSLANDNLSGIALLTELAALVSAWPTRLSYRFVFAPATIGSISWLSQNRRGFGRIKAGLVTSVIGDRGHPHYKSSRQGDAWIDRVVPHVLHRHADEWTSLPFIPYGYDERQFCSPGVNLPIGRLTRSPNGGYPQYHTSADDLSVIDTESLAHSLHLFLQVLGVLESDRRFVNTQPYGEPQLGRRGLYRALGGFQDIEQRQMAMLWALNLSDGENSVLEIAERAGLYCREIDEICAVLADAGLLENADSSEG